MYSKFKLSSYTTSSFIVFLALELSVVLREFIILYRAVSA